MVVITPSHMAPIYIYICEVTNTMTMRGDEVEEKKEEKKERKKKERHRLFIYLNLNYIDGGDDNLRPKKSLKESSIL